MKITSSLLFSVTLLALGASNAGAAVLSWNFGLNVSTETGAYTSGTAENFSVGSFSIGNSLGTVGDPITQSSTSSGYTGASGNNNIGNAFRIGALDTGSGGSGYYEITITPAAGYTIDLTNLDFGNRSTSTGPKAYALRTSLDSFASDVFTGTLLSDGVWTYKDNSVSLSSTTPGEAVTLRLYMYNGAGNPGNNTINGRIDDVTMTITAVPETSAALLGALGVLGMLRRRR